MTYSPLDPAGTTRGLDRWKDREAIPPRDAPLSNNLRQAATLRRGDIVAQEAT